MASIEEDIVSWSISRPVWQRNLLARIARGDLIDQEWVDQLARRIVADEVTLEEPVLRLEDIPTSSSAGKRIELVSVGNLAGVNALLPDQVLSFGAEGLTVIYGDNGSGKSGYARLMKDAVQARHHEAILPNAYDAKPPVAQSADIAYRIDGVEYAAKWPALNQPELTQVGFYDEACGDDYLVSETELAYRPSVLTIFDRLIAVTDQVRAAVDLLVAENKMARPDLPALEPGTKAAAFVSGLHSGTPETEIDALELAAEEEQQLADALNEEARLKGTDPTSEKIRLGKAAKDMAAVAAHFDRVEILLGPDHAEAVTKQIKSAADLRTAATAASAEQFSAEPLTGVGGDAWRALWEAAKRFSEEDAYSGRDFPAVDDGDHCVLCQQPLDGNGRDRLTRFHRFVHNDVAKRASEAERAAALSMQELDQFVVSSTQTTAVLGFLVNEDRILARKLQSALEVAAKAKTHIGQKLRGETDDAWTVLDAVDTGELRTLAAAIQARSDAIDAAEFRKSLEDATKRRAELSAHVELCKNIDAVKAERLRLVAAERLRVVRGALSTAPMTTKASELTRIYVTAAVSNQYIRESDRLKLDRVVLGDKGGSKGRLRQQPALEGAQGRTPKEVLSEGEQTAAGLAGLFTEVHFDETKSAIVLDDPVSSLDHERRRSAARRAATIATDRQVVIFTHDLTFLGELVKAAAEMRVQLTERTIERDGERQPGRVINGYPWKAKDARQRLGDLRAELDRIATGRKTWSSEENELRTANWAGRLSETWERFVRSEIADRVVDGGSNEVRPMMFRILAKITEEDNLQFQAGYGAVSAWAPRHDKSDESNPTPPSIEEMRAELERADAWYRRVSGYAKSK